MPGKGSRRALAVLIDADNTSPRYPDFSPTFVARGPSCRAKTVIVGRTDRKTLKA